MWLMDNYDDIDVDEVVARPLGWWISCGQGQQSEEYHRRWAAEVCVWLDHRKPGAEAKQGETDRAT